VTPLRYDQAEGFGGLRIERMEHQME
jgi:hypothetical protein